MLMGGSSIGFKQWNGTYGLPVLKNWGKHKNDNDQWQMSRHELVRYGCFDDL